MNVPKKTIATIVHCLLMLGVANSAAFATPQASPLGSIYVSAVPDGRVGFIQADPLEEFEFYIVADIDFGDIGNANQNADNGPSYWEASISIPPEVILTGVFVNPVDVQNAGNTRNWIVFLNSAVATQGQPLWLVRYTALFTSATAPTDLVVDLGTTNPTLFPDTGGPGWLESITTDECRTMFGPGERCKRLFAEVYGLRINCVTECTVTTEQKTWGSMKANFGG